MGIFIAFSPHIPAIYSLGSCFCSFLGIFMAFSPHIPAIYSLGSCFCSFHGYFYGFFTSYTRNLLSTLNFCCFHGYFYDFFNSMPHDSHSQTLIFAGLAAFVNFQWYLNLIFLRNTHIPASLHRKP